jgi:predicted Zn-dependent protease
MNFRFIHLLLFVNISLTAEQTSQSVNLINDLLFLGNTALKAVDEAGQEVFSLKPTEETQVGTEVFRKFKNDYRLYEDQPTLARVKRLAEPLLRYRKRKEIQYSFLLVEAHQTNAFSHLGGFIYLNRGLLNFTSSDAELQFVLGHEIGHVDLGHCSRKVTYAYRANRLAETSSVKIAEIVQIAYSIAATGFSQADELAADEWAYKAMKMTGRSANEILAAPKAFADLESNNSPINSSIKKDQFADILEKHFRTHPPFNVRLKNLENLK